MNSFFYIMLFIFGTLFGSFASVIIYRIKSGESGIFNGRSHCGSCNKILRALDLIPIFSYLFNKGKCYSCSKQVSAIYPFLEISTGFLFAFIAYFLIDFTLILNGNSIEIIKLIFFLLIGFFTIIYTFYDILFLEIPEIILGLGIIGITIILSAQTLFPSFHIISNIPAGVESISLGIQAIILSIIILIGLYIVMLKGLHEVADVSIVVGSILALYIFKVFYGIHLTEIAIFNGLIGAGAIFIFFFLQILVSKGAWMGGGDLRIAIFIGLILGVSLSFPGMMATYVAGSFLSFGYIISAKIKNKGGALETQVPFGPFLAIGFFITLFYQVDILKFIEIYF
ncbi:prepilin peptidase [Candidatus Gracilibacteria bacterium 28_42_T64]|nr:prepilin peptidase [Candidatus Gracilibacteria bacterium 28_42_T64]